MIQLTYPYHSNEIKQIVVNERCLCIVNGTCICHPTVSTSMQIRGCYLNMYIYMKINNKKIGGMWWNEFHDAKSVYAFVKVVRNFQSGILTGDYLVQGCYYWLATFHKPANFIQLSMACASVTTWEMILYCESISRRCGATLRAPKVLATLNHKTQYYINLHNHQNKVSF